MLIRNLFSGKRKQPESVSELSASGHDRENRPYDQAIPVKPSQPKEAKEQGSTHSGQQNNRVSETSEPITSPSKRQQPYFIQVGFDFGTSFSKCVCRDVMTNKAWVHIPSKSNGHELPFLIPSILLFLDGKLQYVPEQGVHYPKWGLYHLKQALVKVALAQMADPVLAPYRRVCDQFDIGDLVSFVRSCAVYLIAGALGTVREQIRQRLVDFGSHPDDYMAVNLAIPVADAEQPNINNLYHAILCESWSLADIIPGHPSLYLKELGSLRKHNLSANGQAVRDACFIYPEVSANVQGFVRSRVSSPGMYLFSDTGAATVDQSTFIFIHKPDNTEHLTYLHGKVLPFGSSQIEFLAATNIGKRDRETLEMFRKKKERGDNDVELVKAKNMLAEQLEQGTITTLAYTKKKLIVRNQIEGIRVIFGGGGHCEYPYERSILGRPFSCNLFREAIKPNVVKLPPPKDLDVSDPQRQWMGRLAVAYGLSFLRGDLASFTYPRDVKHPEPDQIWPRFREIPDLISKDQC
jgi:hypothetical protein